MASGIIHKATSNTAKNFMGPPGGMNSKEMIAVFTRSFRSSAFFEGQRGSNERGPRQLRQTMRTHISLQFQNRLHSSLIDIGFEIEAEFLANRLHFTVLGKDGRDDGREFFVAGHFNQALVQQSPQP